MTFWRVRPDSCASGLRQAAQERASDNITLPSFLVSPWVAINDNERYVSSAGSDRCPRDWSDAARVARSPHHHSTAFHSEPATADNTTSPAVGTLAQRRPLSHDGTPYLRCCMLGSSKPGFGGQRGGGPTHGCGRHGLGERFPGVVTTMLSRVLLRSERGPGL